MTERRVFTPAVILWGVGVGIFQAFCPVAMWWFDAVDIWGVALALIASVYVGFAVGDGRRKVIVVEVLVTFAFVICGWRSCFWRRCCRRMDPLSPFFHFAFCILHFRPPPSASIPAASAAG
jgi:hypothetical protein